MSTPPGPDPVRPTSASRWTQPSPPRGDENLKLVHRKIDQNLKFSHPAVVNGDRDGAASDRTSLPGAPDLMAQLTHPGRNSTAGRHNRPVPPAASEAQPRAEPGNELAAAWEKRMAMQWEDVATRLCREFAPAGGADADVVLEHIAQQRLALDSATVRDYLPVLVDRAVRRLLAPERAAEEK